MIKAYIITIGDEILIGQIIDTNSAWMAVELNSIGIEIKKIISIHDKEEEILKTIEEAFKEADILLITGGLGPTKDDITKHTLAKYFNSQIVFSEEVYEHLQKILTTIKAKTNKLNKSQAEVPENAEILMNNAGTAPCMWFRNGNKVLVSMPGVPNEMKWLMENRILPKIKEEFDMPYIHHRTIMTQGTFEADLAEKLNKYEEDLPENIKLAYLPSSGIIRLRLSAFGNNNENLKEEVEEQVNMLHKYIPDLIYGYENESLAEVVGKILKERGATISTAESCTGGSIAEMLTSTPGSSSYFKGSVVAYDNEVKKNILEVNPNTIQNSGAVSEEVVKEMAEGAIKKLKSNYAIATSGIAGPTGGTEEKPVGTVCIAIATPDKTYTNKFLFGSKREYNIRKTSLTALGWIRKILLNRDC